MSGFLFAPADCEVCGGPHDHSRHRAETADWDRRERRILAESGMRPGMWWLSFVGDEGFRGVTIVRAFTLGGAIEEAWRLGANPGGEIGSIEIAPGDEHLIPEDCLGRLMSRDEIVRRGLA